jgi:hydrogenase maturation protease
VSEGPLLLAGIGNVLQTDDGFGVEVARRLADRSWPAGVEVGEFGIRGVHLAYQLLDGYRALILVDTVELREPPGTLAVIEGEVGAGPSPQALDAHTMSPAVVLGTLSQLGGTLDRVVVVGCQPADLGEGIGLSPAVEGAVDGACRLCVELVAELCTPGGKGTGT